MNFHVGQKVVCVDAGDINPNSGVWLPGEEIIEGNVYTICATFLHPTQGVPMVSLVEVERSQRCLELWGHAGYGACRFRPVVERKTDISIFTSMLNPNRVEA